MDAITVNKRSSIRLAGKKTLYFDPWDIPGGGDGDLIFVTHEHHDHFIAADVVKAGKPGSVQIVPASMAEKFLAETGISEEQCLFVEPGKAYEVLGIIIEAIPAYNLQKRFHPRENGWCGYVVTMGGTRYYVMGDTDDTPEARGVDCDVLLLPVGGTYTMDAEEAAHCAAAIAPHTAIPTHYDTEVGTPEEGKRFRDALKKRDPAITVEILL